MRGSVIFSTFFSQYFPVNFHFLQSDTRYSREFFTIDTFDHGLSFHGIESALSSNIFWLKPYTIFRERDHLYRASWSNQWDRFFRN
jgi:hypothetical protein